MGRPGRPPKWSGPVKRIYIILPYELAVEMERAKGNKSWSDFLIELYDVYKAHKVVT